MCYVSKKLFSKHNQVLIKKFCPPVLTKVIMLCQWKATFKTYYLGSYLQLKKPNLVPKNFNLVPKKIHLMPKSLNLVPQKFDLVPNNINLVPKSFKLLPKMFN